MLKTYYGVFEKTIFKNKYRYNQIFYQTTNCLRILQLLKKSWIDSEDV